MKRMVSMALALALAFALCVPGNAAESAVRSQESTARYLQLSATGTVTASFTGGSDADGDTADVSEPAGTWIALPASGFTRTGYDFAGWRIGTDTYQPGDVYVLTEPVTFTAVWTVRQTNVVLDDGSGCTTTLSAKYGDWITLPSCPFTKEGYVFHGWSDGDRVYQPGNSYFVDAQTTLTAQWTPSAASGGETGSVTGGSSTDIGGFDDGSTGGDTAATSFGEATGTVTGADGSTTTVETRSDGSVSRTVVTADGVTGVTVIDQHGNYQEASAVIPEAAAKAADGGTITLPVTVPLAETSGDALAVSISVPASAGPVKVELPVEDVSTGAVAMLVQPDSTEKLVKTSLITDSGVSLVITGDTTVKIVDNSKYFEDIPDGFWAKKEVDLVSSRELFNGTTADTFTPDAPTTRAQLMTVLARLDDADTTGAALQKGMAWAVESGISDGANPSGSITRQQLATMLYRYAGNPTTNGSLASYPDADKVSGYAREAMRWAVESGIITGRSDGTLDPTGLATRAQVAAIMSRYMAKVF